MNTRNLFLRLLPFFVEGTDTTPNTPTTHTDDIVIGVVTTVGRQRGSFGCGQKVFLQYAFGERSFAIQVMICVFTDALASTKCLWN